jgi:hypothetical protein
LQCLEALETCAAVDTSITCFKEALTQFNDGAALPIILKTLRKSPRFNTALANNNNQQL